MVFVTCSHGMEQLLFQELSLLGISGLKQSYGGVYAPKKMDVVYKVNYCSRIAVRVLWPLATFRCATKEMLYKGACKIHWPDFLTINDTFAIDANISATPAFRNSHFAALVVKDALCDTFREVAKARPSVATYMPDVQFHLYLHKEEATLSIDTSTVPLYKRGYRHQQSTAPLQESLAVAILKLANYTAEDILCDPFCGSGTFLIEAAMVATKTPAGFFRKQWGFFRLPTFFEEAWLNIKAGADSQRQPLHSQIFGADKDPKAVALCNIHLKDAGFKEIDVEAKDVRSYFPKVAPNLVICNPPYGKRLGASLEVYQALAHFLRTKCAQNVRAFVLTPETPWVEAMGLHIAQREELFHGGEKVGLFKLAPISCT